MGLCGPLPHPLEFWQAWSYAALVHAAATAASSVYNGSVKLESGVLPFTCSGLFQAFCKVNIAICSHFTDEETEA